MILLDPGFRRGDDFLRVILFELNILSVIVSRFIEQLATNFPLLLKVFTL